MPDTQLPPILYKYVGPENIRILENQLVHFSKLSALNDPFEGRPFIEGITDDPSTIESEGNDIIRAIASGDADDRIREIYQERVEAGEDLAMSEEEFLEAARERSLHHAENGAEQLIRENASFQGGRITRRQFADTVAARFDDYYGMLCLAESAANPLMWSHYAASHKGLCLGFDSAHHFFHQAPHPERKIGQIIKATYSDKRPRLLWDTSGLTEAEVEDRWITCFMQAKSQHWKYEGEYRIVRPLQTLLNDSDVSELDRGTEGGALFTLPANAVVSVTLGMKAEPGLKRSVREVLEEPRYSHVVLKQADIHDEDYTVTIHDVE